jgi:hypothetical protein
MRDAQFSPRRDQHRNPPFTQDDWRFLSCRGEMRDHGNVRVDDGFWIDAGYCLDRHSQIDYDGRPGHKGR